MSKQVLSPTQGSRRTSQSEIQASHPEIRKIDIADLRACLANGWADFRAHPTQLFFLCLIYPVAGLALCRVAAGQGVVGLLYPLATGFVLLGPIAGIGLYEISLRRERGQAASWRNCFDLLYSPALGSAVTLALLLIGVFIVWIAIAQSFYNAAFGAAPIGRISDITDVLFHTAGGWFLTIGGNLVGLAFATIVLGISVISFPMILDRNVGAVLAMRTSVRAVRANRIALALWGLLVAVLVVAATVLGLVGLAIVLPVLGHASWHLYRRLVAA